MITAVENIGLAIADIALKCGLPSARFIQKHAPLGSPSVAAHTTLHAAMTADEYDDRVLLLESFKKQNARLAETDQPKALKLALNAVMTYGSGNIADAAAESAASIASTGYISDYVQSFEILNETIRLHSNALASNTKEFLIGSWKKLADSIVALSDKDHKNDTCHMGFLPKAHVAFSLDLMLKTPGFESLAATVYDQHPSLIEFKEKRPNGGYAPVYLTQRMGTGSR